MTKLPTALKDRSAVLLSRFSFLLRPYSKETERAGGALFLPIVKWHQYGMMSEV
ncbi:MAG: hypothetical protein F6K24_35040 [Okeania sp. SIO2D1]|nr:hypothetical protein [Okeania sp. SIO2D1]